MGITNVLRMRTDQEQITAALAAHAPVLGEGDMPIASPWSDPGDLEQILYRDVFGVDAPPVNTRTAAMRLDGIARSRNLLCTTISRMPLRAANAAGVLPPEQQPTWLYRTNETMGPRLRIVLTIDDLIFHGYSLWLKRRGTDGFPLSANRVPWGQWHIDADLQVCVNGLRLVDQRDALVFVGFHEGILNYGRDVLADAKALYAIVRDRLANPVPMVELHQKSGPRLNPTERAELVRSWRLARQQQGGDVGYTSEEIELITHGAESESALLIEGRNAATVSLARIVGVSAGRIDATTPKASLNYETTQGRNQELVDFDLDLYMGPIEERLSLDDCVPRGTRVVFDRTDSTAPAASPTGPDLQD